MLEKLVLFDWSYNPGAIDVEKGSVCSEGKIIFQDAGTVFLF